MLNVLQITNPYDPNYENTARTVFPDGLSVRQVLEGLYPGFTEFEFPTLCLVNGEPRLRATWDDVLPPEATVSFVRLAGGVVGAIIAIVVLIVAVAVALMIKPQNPSAIGAGDVPGEQQNGETVYSLTGEKNQIRLNSSIEACYGRNRMFPAYAASPYSVYNGNDQYQFSLFCLGHGTFTISEMRFEDTAFSKFDDLEFEIVDPGETFDLFADNVATSSAVAGIELYANNEDEFTGPTVAFAVNEPFTKCTRIEVDISLPAGLYVIKNGKVEDAEVEVDYQYQSISDTGRAIGAWKSLLFTTKTKRQKVRVRELIPETKDQHVYLGREGQYDPINLNGVDLEDKELLSKLVDEAIEKYRKEHTVFVKGKPEHYAMRTRTIFVDETTPNFFRRMATTTPQRFTMGARVEPGRYQIRAVRVDKKDMTINSGHTVRWETLRAFFPSVRRYGDVTLIAIKARATNNLNNNAASRFNVIATRRLPVWDSLTEQWSDELVATRNPVWAFCDVFRATYGGRLPDTFLDLKALSTLAKAYAEDEVYFDHMFDQKTTVWEAARAVGLVGRAMPMLNGSRLTLIRAEPKFAALAVFNQNNIVQGSLSWSIKLRNVEDADGLEVQYMDPETWQMETVLCLLENDNGANPEQMKLPGCTSRKQAYQEGLYQRATSLYCKENIEFQTGLEGMLPKYGDLIMVTHDVPRWGTGGTVTAINGEVLTLSEPVQFTPNLNHRIVLRRKDGSSYGPVYVTPGSDEYHVTVSPAIVEPFYFDDVHSRPFFLFGLENAETKRCTVVGIIPQGEDVVTLKCVNYDARTFSYKAAPTPAKYAPAKRVVEPARPTVAEINVAATANKSDFVQVSWTPALGAKSYVLEQSTDAVNWTRVSVVQNTVYELRVDPGYLWLRVAGVNIDIGDFVTWQGRVGDVGNRPGNVQNFRLTNLGPGYADFTWDALLNADRYEMGVYDRIAGIMLRTVTVDSRFYRYTLAEGELDGLTTNEVLFRVKGVNLRGRSEDAAVLTIIILDRPVDDGTPTTTDQTFTIDEDFTTDQI